MNMYELGQVDIKHVTTGLPKALPIEEINADRSDKYCQSTHTFRVFECVMVMLCQTDYLFII